MMAVPKCLAFMPHDVKENGISCLIIAFSYTETRAGKFAEVYIKEKKTMSPAPKMKLYSQKPKFFGERNIRSFICERQEPLTGAQ